MTQPEYILSRYRKLFFCTLLFLLHGSFAVASGKHTYGVDHVASSIHILVFRDGPLRVLGHNHVIRIPDLEGKVTLDTLRPYHSTYSIKIPVGKMEVDVPLDRKKAGAGFENEVEPSDAIATKNNMLGPRLLDVNRYPFINITGISEKTAHGVNANSRICIRDHCVEYTVPLRVKLTKTSIIASGELKLLQSDHGIIPYSLLGGVLRVRNEIRILFTIVTRLQTGNIK